MRDFSCRIWRVWLIAGAAVLVLTAAPAIADPVDTLTRGVDVWETAGEGFTVSNFLHDPIPAGFFCPDSEAFDGRIALRGAPLATEPAGALGRTDTIVYRLDDAKLDESGEATTRLQLLALSLEGIEPLETSCGAFHVAVTLDEDQPVTEMTIVRETGDGGYYEAPLALRMRLAFTPVDGNGPVRTLSRRVDLGPGTHSYWSTQAVPAVEARRPTRVDTDGDGRPDTVLPAPSNFIARAADSGGLEPSVSAGGECRAQTCHCDPTATDPDVDASKCTHFHCVWVIYPDSYCWAQ